MNKSTPVKVYAKDRKTVIATVSKQATSIGAAKAAKVPSCQFNLVNGEWAWTAA